MTQKLFHLHTYLRQERGSILLASLIMMVMLGMLSLTFVSKIAYEKAHSGHWRRGDQAFYLAEAGISKGISLINTGDIAQYPYAQDNLTLGSGTFSFTVEQQPAYEAASRYLLKGVGEVAGVKRGVEVLLQEDSFLRFSRLVEGSSLVYDSDAVISGDVGVGQDLNLLDYSVVFEDTVTVEGEVIHEDNGVFYESVLEGGEVPDIAESLNIQHYQDLAQGYVPGEGTGIYSCWSSAIDLSLFDFSTSPPTYGGVPLGNDFNGIVFIQGDAYVSGDLEGASVTVIASDDIIITDHVRTVGKKNTQQQVVFNAANKTETQVVSIDNILRTASPDASVSIRTAGRKWNKVTGTLWADGSPMASMDCVEIERFPGSPDEQTQAFDSFVPESGVNYSVELVYTPDPVEDVGGNPVWIRAGEPVNIGLAAQDAIYISPEAPRKLVVDAAIFSAQDTWTALGDEITHPSGLDEEWNLIINGPIITHQGGSAGPWTNNGKRKYKYDEDIVEYPPPHFPKPLLKRVYWKELHPSDLS